LSTTSDDVDPPDDAIPPLDIAVLDAEAALEEDDDREPEEDMEFDDIEWEDKEEDDEEDE